VGADVTVRYCIVVRYNYYSYMLMMTILYVHLYVTYMCTYLPCTNSVYCVSKNKHGSGLLTDNVGTDNVHRVHAYSVYNHIILL